MSASHTSIGARIFKVGAKMADLLWRACILAQWRDRGQTDIAFDLALIARSNAGVDRSEQQTNHQAIAGRREEQGPAERLGRRPRPLS
jgi:hypothetical protein